MPWPFSRLLGIRGAVPSLLLVWGGEPAQNTREVKSGPGDALKSGQRKVGTRGLVGLSPHVWAKKGKRGPGRGEEKKREKKNSRRAY